MGNGGHACGASGFCAAFVWGLQVSLELGGKSPIIIFDDADLDKAVAESHYAVFWNAGQCCSAAARIFVHEAVYDAYIAKAVAMARARQLGHPMDEGVEAGPVQNAAAFERVKTYIRGGIAQGATLELGGLPGPAQKGWFIPTTIFSGVTDDMTIAQEEIFGPVMCVLRFRTADEVVARANASRYGLVAAVYSSNIDRALHCASRLQCGTKWINSFNIIYPQLPWGGVKSSGHGRDLSKLALEEYTHTETVIIDVASKL